MCLCVCVQLWSRILAFQHHFLRMCSHAFQSRRDCFCVRKCVHVSVCVRALAIPISLMLVLAFRLYLINITSFNDFQMHKLNYKLQTSTLCLVDDTWSRNLSSSLEERIHRIHNGSSSFSQALRAIFMC